MNLLELLMTDYTFRTVATGATILGATSGVIGSFAILKKRGLLGDAVSHASLPGIAIIFIIFQVKNIGLFMLGALISGLIATIAITLIDNNTRIKIDSAMAMVLSVFFGFGLVLLTYIQKIPNANQAGIEYYIFGQASTLLSKEIYLIIGVSIALVALVIIFWKELKIATFDPGFSESIGFNAKRIDYLLTSMIVVAIVIGLQTVGVILMSALLVSPGVAARQWTDDLKKMVSLAALFGGVSGLLGTYISSSLGKMPTGPSIVIVVSIITLISILFAPNRGIIWGAIRDRNYRKNINSDQVLISIYWLALNHNDPFRSHDIGAIKPVKTKGKQDISKLKEVLEGLKQRNLVEKASFDHWRLTEQGLNYVKTQTIVKGEEGA